MAYKKKRRGYSGELQPLDDDFTLLSPRKPDNYRDDDDEFFWSTTVTPVVLDRDDNTCIKCGAPAELVHHNSYDPDISIDDLASLCKRCHQRLHKRAEYDSNDYNTNWDDWDDSDDWDNL